MSRKIPMGLFVSVRGLARRDRANASPGSLAWASWRMIESSPTSSTCTTLMWPFDVRNTPISLSLPKRIGSPWTRRMRLSSRVSLSLSGSQAPSLKMLQFW